MKVIGQMLTPSSPSTSKPPVDEVTGEFPKMLALGCCILQAITSDTYTYCHKSCKTKQSKVRLPLSCIWLGYDMTLI